MADFRYNQKIAEFLFTFYSCTFVPGIFIKLTGKGLKSYLS